MEKTREGAANVENAHVPCNALGGPRTADGFRDGATGFKNGSVEERRKG